MKTKRSSSYSFILLGAILLTMTLGATPVNAFKIEGSEMCLDVDTTSLKPEGVGKVYFTNSLETIIWVNMTDPPSSVSFKWYKPGDVYYTRTVGDVETLLGESWGVAHSSIPIDGKAPANNPGKWLVESYVDGELRMETEFQIIDYAQIVEDILAQMQSVDNIQGEIDQLLSDYNELVEDYTSLTDDYVDIQSDKESIEDDYEELQDEYDELDVDYSKLEASLGSNRTMMYGALAVAVASVAVAVYFGAIKK